jgi:predicted metal-binding protein
VTGATQKGREIMDKRYQVVGVNDENDYCECFGKKNLKRVVWINDTESGEVKHFGTTCATRPAKGFDVEKEVKAAIEKFDRRVQMVNHLTHYEYKRQGGKMIVHPTKEHTWTHEDKALYDSIRAEINTRNDFNF